MLLSVLAAEPDGGFDWFQWAPTLGGECYPDEEPQLTLCVNWYEFQWAPTLGGECYGEKPWVMFVFGLLTLFQWAPTLGGECYTDL